MLYFSPLLLFAFIHLAVRFGAAYRKRGMFTQSRQGCLLRTRNGAVGRTSGYRLNDTLNSFHSLQSLIPTALLLRSQLLLRDHHSNLERWQHPLLFSSFNLLSNPNIFRNTVSSAEAVPPGVSLARQPASQAVHIHRQLKQIGSPLGAERLHALRCTRLKRGPLDSSLRLLFIVPSTPSRATFEHLTPLYI